MKKIFKILTAIVLLATIGASNANAKKQDIQILTANNESGKITKDTIETAFKSNGFLISGNNNMNAPFKVRFKAGNDFKMYRLMFVYNPVLSSKLAKQYPSIGLLAPLSTSVYSKDGKTINISSLTLKGMSKITKIPETNKDLIAIYDNMQKALKDALPNGKFQSLNYKIEKPEGALVTSFEAEFEAEGDMEEAKEGFQEEFEGEVEPLGFIVAGFTSFNEDLTKNGIDTYDFYDTYSICKLEVIFPVHKLHPEVGAFAPCTMYMYKKKGENKMHLGFPSVHNWISSVDIKDKESLKPLLDAQKALAGVLSELTE
jgi:uncharacterized protein (DUF302 family)